MKDLKRLNPQIQKVEIGVRQLREIDIFPLSLSDELSVIDLITEALQAFMVSDGAQKSDVAFVSFLVDVLSKNIAQVLTLVTDENGDDLVKEITNPQVVKIAEIVFENNFASVSKNVKSLSQKVMNTFQLERQSPQFVKPMDTGLNTSSEEVTRTEESPEDS